VTLIGIAVKRCGKCRQELPLVAFSLDRYRRDGLAWRCKPCSRAAQRAYPAKRPDRPHRRRPTKSTCRNCRNRKHGRWCSACPCRCRAVLGLDGPFDFGDPTAPDGAGPDDVESEVA